MNILVFSWRDPKHPLAGGAEQVMHEHMKGWSKAGHEVTLFSSFFKGAKREEKLDGIRIIRRGVQLGGVQILGVFWYLFGSHQKFDLVVDQFHGIPFFTPLYVFTKKLAVIQEVAKEVWLMNHLPAPLNWIVGYAGYILEPVIFLFYKRTPFMTGSESARSDLLGFGIPEKVITVIPHGVLLPDSRYQVRDTKIETRTIIYLGALTRDKGVEDAIKTISILNRERKYVLWIVGRGSDVYISKLRKLAKELGVLGRVKFWGFVEERKKFELLARAHLLVNPSVREGWGLNNIEANSVGTPVVVYNSPGLVDSVKNTQNGIICRENSVTAMAKEAAALLGDRSRYRKMQAACIRWAESFDWEKSRTKSLALLDSIVLGKYSLNK